MNNVLGVVPYLGMNPATDQYPDHGFLFPALAIRAQTYPNTFTPGLVALPNTEGNHGMGRTCTIGSGKSGSTSMDTIPMIQLVFRSPPYFGHTGREQPHQHETLPLNANPDVSDDCWSGNCLVGGLDFAAGNPLVHQLYWGPVTRNPLATKARNAFACTFCEDTLANNQLYYKNMNSSPYVVGVSNEYGAGRSVFWSFGYYDLSLGYRNRPTWDTLEWLRDGIVRGTVVQNNPNLPIQHALVVAAQSALISATNPTGFAGANYTDQNGNYVLYGLRPGSAIITVIANGYESLNNVMVTPVVGGAGETRNFYLTQSNMAYLTGFVTLHGVPVSGAPVSADPAAGNLPPSTTVSQADGSYSLTLPAGTYNLSASSPVTGQSITIPNVMVLANLTVTQNIELAPLTTVTVAVNPVTSASLGTPVTITANCDGGVSVQYQYWVYNPAASPAWSQVQAYSPAATCNWIPMAPGNYLISVTAKDGATGTEVNQTCWYTVTCPPLTAVDVATAPASSQVIDTPVTLMATATGGFNDQFMFWVYNPTATPAWSLLQAYSAQNTCPWMPQVAGAYLISVTARDGTTGEEVNQRAGIPSLPPVHYRR